MGPNSHRQNERVAKPFNYPELAARIAAVLRRARVRRERGLVQVGGPSGYET
jgi:DNA-binding response OmpR family regulator